MATDRTIAFRRRYRSAYFFACLLLASTVSLVRIVTLGYRGSLLLPLLVIAGCTGLLFLYSAGRTFAYRAELKRSDLIATQRIYGGGEFVSAADARAKLGDDNIWRP